MPQTNVLFYREDDGSVPVLDWLDQLLKKGQRKPWAKCHELIRRLAEFGFELRRPLADTLRDGIHELRAKQGGVNYRILYFFHGRNVAVLAHALMKREEVPDMDIDRAVRRKKAFEQDPGKHSYAEDEGDGQDQRRPQNPQPQGRPRR